MLTQEEMDQITQGQQYECTVCSEVVNICGHGVVVILKYERQRAERAETWAALWKRAATDQRKRANANRQAMLEWSGLREIERTRAWRAEQDVKRLREALEAMKRELEAWHSERPCPPEMRDSCVSCGVIDDASAALAGTLATPETPQEALIRAGDELVREIDAALAGTPEAPPEFTPAEREAILSGSLTVPRSVVERAEQEQAREERWCTEDRHIVLPSGEACVCGENRTERML